MLEASNLHPYEICACKCAVVCVSVRVCVPASVSVNTCKFVCTHVCEHVPQHERMSISSKILWSYIDLVIRRRTHRIKQISNNFDSYIAQDPCGHTNAPNLFCACSADDLRPDTGDRSVRILQNPSTVLFLKQNLHHTPGVYVPRYSSRDVRCVVSNMSGGWQTWRPSAQSFFQSALSICFHCFTPTLHTVYMRVQCVHLEYFVPAL